MFDAKEIQQLISDAGLALESLDSHAAAVGKNGINRKREDKDSIFFGMLEYR